MAELKDLLAGCTATDPAGIEAYINEQMKAQNIKMFLDDGVVAEVGTPAEVFGAPKCERLKSFLAKVL